MRRHLVRSFLLFATLALGASCENVLGPSQSTRASRSRLGDYVLPVGAVDVVPVSHFGDTITVRMTSLDPSSCAYGGSMWVVYAFRAYVVPYGVRAGNRQCPPTEVRMRAPGVSIGGAPEPPVLAVLTLPARVVVCQPESEPLTTYLSVVIPVHTEDGRAHFLALQRQMLVERANGNEAREDRELCAKMVKS